MKTEEIKIGTPVIYWGVITDRGDRMDPLKTAIQSEPYDVSGTTVCDVAGISGCVAITHLDLITPGSLIAAKLFLR